MIEMIIYKITNLLNNKIYIGKTTRKLNARRLEHLSDSRVGSKLPIHNAIRKYGENNFSFEVIDEANTQEELNDKEVYWIKKYNSYIHWNNSNGYNLSIGGDGASGGEGHHMYGKKGENHHSSIPIIQLSLDGEVIKVHENSSFGANSVGGSRGNITKCCQGGITHVYNSIWIYADDYNEDYIKERVDGYKVKSERNQVVQLTKDGKLVAIYDTAKDGGVAINGNGTSVTACCKCRPKYKTYKGFIWLYKSDYDNEIVRAERIDRANNRWK
jgi:group I intron endonuclease